MGIVAEGCAALRRLTRQGCVWMLVRIFQSQGMAGTVDAKQHAGPLIATLSP